MTTMLTPGEIRSSRNGRVPVLDSPAVPARAGARIPVTLRTNKIQGRVRVGLSRWWVWTARPMSLRVAWKLGAVDPKRVPAKSAVLRHLWLVSNHTDRLLMFALILIAPTAAQGPLRWMAERPTRRYGLYLTVAALTTALIIGRTH